MKANFDPSVDKLNSSELSPQDAAAINEQFKRMRPILRVLHGLSIVEWFRMAQDEYGRTGDIAFAHVARSLCARSGRIEPEWVTQAHLEESHAICDAALSIGLERRPYRANPVYRAVRDFRVAHQVYRITRTNQISPHAAFKVVAKMLPANRGASYSKETSKRAWYRYTSKRAFDALHK